VAPGQVFDCPEDVAQTPEACGLVECYIATEKLVEMISAEFGVPESKATTSKVQYTEEEMRTISAGIENVLGVHTSVDFLIRAKFSSDSIHYWSSSFRKTFSLFPFSTNGTDWDIWIRDTLRD